LGTDQTQDLTHAGEQKYLLEHSSANNGVKKWSFRSYIGKQDSLGGPNPPPGEDAYKLRRKEAENHLEEMEGPRAKGAMQYDVMCKRTCFGITETILRKNFSIY
jgi:hypothetical protein